MTTATAGPPRILHTLPGRLRVHLPTWPGDGALSVEQHLRRLPGVRRVAANPLTGNVLISFDPRTTSEAALLAALGEPRDGAAPREDGPLPPVVDEEEQGPLHRARIAVRGLDRDPRLAGRVVERLRRLFGVQARASPLTSRVVVEYDERRVDLRDLLAKVAEVELPDLPGEDRPAHPLDRAPLLQGATRAVGAALGLGVLAVRHLLGRLGPLPAARTAATTAGVLGLLRSFPALRSGLRRLLGRHAADLAFGAAGIVSLTLARGYLGLAVIGTEGLWLWSEVRARRTSWRRYEEGLGGAADAEPGAVIRLGAGETSPLRALVVEGAGTALGRDGLPRPIAPGAHLSAGARLVGGPVVLQLEGGKPFQPQPRPAPLVPSLYTRYLSAVAPLSLGYAAVTALLTRSLKRTFEALLLVNPRPAMIGMEAANLDAAARVLRRGVIVVGTRPRRAIRRPDVLLLDGPRVLTDGLEITGVLPAEGGAGMDEVLAVAAGVSLAAGSPWGDVFASGSPWGEAFLGEGCAPGEEGSFNGLWAAATVRGTRYTLGPPEDPPELPEAARLLHEGGYLLAVGREEDGRPLGFIALQPRLAAGAAELAGVCRRHGVALEMLGGGSLAVAEGVARRAGVPLCATADPVAVIRERQGAGAFVAFVSDSAHAAPAFADCDLAVGLLWEQAARFPARADLLARDLGAVAEVVHAGARRETAVRDAVVLSGAANVFGAVWGLRGRPGVLRASRAVYLSALATLADGWFRLRGGK
jgi:hypothetical protein